MLWCIARRRSEAYEPDQWPSREPVGRSYWSSVVCGEERACVRAVADLARLRVPAEGR